MHSAESAIWTWGALRSASENTATVCIPIFCAVLIMRTAISPRLATSIRSIGFIYLPDEYLNRCRVVCIAGIINLGAVRNQTEYTGLCP